MYICTCTCTTLVYVPRCAKGKLWGQGLAISFPRRWDPSLSDLGSGPRPLPFRPSFEWVDSVVLAAAGNVVNEAFPLREDDQGAANSEHVDHEVLLLVP